LCEKSYDNYKISVISWYSFDGIVRYWGNYMEWLVFSRYIELPIGLRLLLGYMSAGYGRYYIIGGGGYSDCRELDSNSLEVLKGSMYFALSDRNGFRGEVCGVLPYGNHTYWKFVDDIHLSTFNSLINVIYIGEDGGVRKYKYTNNGEEHIIYITGGLSDNEERFMLIGEILHLMVLQVLEIGLSITDKIFGYDGLDICMVDGHKSLVFKDIYTYNNFVLRDRICLLFDNMGIDGEVVEGYVGVIRLIECEFRLNISNDN
jgi:hypothetical protein